MKLLFFVLPVTWWSIPVSGKSRRVRDDIVIGRDGRNIHGKQRFVVAPHNEKSWVNHFKIGRMENAFFEHHTVSVDHGDQEAKQSTSKIPYA